MRPRPLGPVDSVVQWADKPTDVPDNSATRSVVGPSTIIRHTGKRSGMAVPRVHHSARAVFDSQAPLTGSPPLALCCLLPFCSCPLTGNIKASCNAGARIRRPQASGAAARDRSDTNQPSGQPALAITRSYLTLSMLYIRARTLSNAKLCRLKFEQAADLAILFSLCK